MQQMSDKIDNGQEYFNGVVPSGSNLMKKYVKEKDRLKTHIKQQTENTLCKTLQVNAVKQIFNLYISLWRH